MSRFDEIVVVMVTAVLDPNVLNYYQLLSPGVAFGLAAVVTAVSVALTMIISRSFFRSYSFAGFGYLLGLPVGFAFLGASYLFELASVLFMSHPILHPAFFWIQMLLQAEAFALIALSYYYKNSAGDRRSHVSRDIAITILPLLMVAVPFIAPTSVLIAQPYFNYTGFADMSFFMRLFDIIVIGYIFKSAVVSLVKAANVKLLYVPAAFVLLWLEQYSLVIAYFDNSTVAFVGSALARIAGLAAFTYVMHRIFNRRKVEIEARKAT